MPNQDSESPISFDECLEHIRSDVFRLQPKSYGRDYPKWPGLVGIEIEMLPVRQQPGNSTPESVPIYGTKHSLSENLIRCAADQNWTCQVIDETSPSRLFRVYLEDGDQLSFEPGGQLEISTIPYACLSDALKQTAQLQSILDRDLLKDGIEIIQTGINPWHTPEQIGLQMEKKRYRCMTEYFNRISTYGIRMMRQTCTMQVNLDFGATETKLAERFLASQLIAPFATAIFAYSPFVDSKNSGYKSFRGRIWHDVDPSRTGFPDLSRFAATMSKESAVRSYFDKTLDADVIFIAGDEYLVPPRGFSFRTWLADNGSTYRKATMSDFKTHLSLMFPEVRARGFIELRSIDCQARTWQSIPAAFCTGLLYDPKALTDVIELLTPQLTALQDLLKHCVYGMQDQRISEFSKKIFEISMAGYERLPPCFREICSREKLRAYYQHFTARDRSPADDLIDDVNSHGSLKIANFKRLENQWSQGIC